MSTPPKVKALFKGVAEHAQRIAYNINWRDMESGHAESGVMKSDVTETLELIKTMAAVLAECAL